MLLLLASPLTRAEQSAAVRVRIFPSIVPGVNRDEATAATRPLLDNVIAPKLRMGPINFEIVDCNTGAKELLDFGRKLNSGEFDFGIVWGIEYGWLRTTYQDLRAVAYCSYGRAPIKSQLMVGPNFHGNVDLAALKGKKLAVYPRLSFLDALYLNELMQRLKADPKAYFQEVKFLSCGDAASAVNEGKEADCIVMSIDAFAHLQNNVPGNRLRTVDASESFAPGVVIGRRDLVNKKRDRLWEDAVNALVAAHRSKGSKRFMDFWRMESFRDPAMDIQGNSFESFVRKDMERFPFKWNR